MGRAPRVRALLHIQRVVDERVVTLDDPESNYKMCKAMLFDHVPIPPANVHRILLNSASANGAPEAEAAADFRGEPTTPAREWRK